MKKFILFIIICSVLFPSFCGSLGANAQCSSKQLKKVCNACKIQALNSSQCMATSDTDSNCPVCPACPSPPPPNSDISPVPSPSPTSTLQPTTPTIFSDNFSNGFPGRNWVFTTREDETPPQISSSIGNPAPSLSIYTSRPGNFTRSAVNPFNSRDGLSISVDIREPGAPPVSPETRIFVLTISNQNDNRIFARAEIVSGSQNRINYIVTSQPDQENSVTSPYFVDTDFHNFKFVLDVQGNARWFRDGVLQASRTEFPVGDYIVQLEVRTLSGSNIYNYNVDNVIVTIPKI